MGERVQGHPLDEVRGKAEASKEKSRWTLIAREHMARTLLATGYFSSEDFDALGIPPEHVNVGNSQMGIFSKKGYMEPISWRRSSKRSRKSGKIWTYRITEKGRKELVGPGAAVPPGGEGPNRALARDSVGSGESDAGGVRHSSRKARSVGGLPPASTAASGQVQQQRGVTRRSTNEHARSEANPLTARIDQGTGQEGEPGDKSEVPAAAAEPLSLLPESPSMFDPDQRSAA